VGSPKQLRKEQKISETSPSPPSRYPPTYGIQESKSVRHKKSPSVASVPMAMPETYYSQDTLIPVPQPKHLGHKRSASMTSRQSSRFSRQQHSAERLGDSMEESLSIPEDDEIKEYCKAWLEQQILTNFEFVWHAPNKGIVDSNLIPVLKSMPGKPILEEGVRFLHNGKIKVNVATQTSPSFSVGTQTEDNLEGLHFNPRLHEEREETEDNRRRPNVPFSYVNLNPASAPSTPTYPTFRKKGILQAPFRQHSEESLISPIQNRKVVPNSNWPRNFRVDFDENVKVSPIDSTTQKEHPERVRFSDPNTEIPLPSSHNPNIRNIARERRLSKEKRFSLSHTTMDDLESELSKIRTNPSLQRKKVHILEDQRETCPAPNPITMLVGGLDQTSFTPVPLPTFPPSDSIMPTGILSPPLQPSSEFVRKFQPTFEVSNPKVSTVPINSGPDQSKVKLIQHSSRSAFSAPENEEPIVNS